MQNWFSEYIFFNDFTGENRINDARDAFFKAVNDNVNWVIFSSHGHPSHITNERVLRASDQTHFNNVEHPVILFSMSCSNGAFIRNTDSSMCKSFLFTPNGGAIAYIATPNVAYSSSNNRLIQSVCALNDTNPQHSIGHLLTQVQSTSQRLLMDYQIIGDPAIRINRSRQIDISLTHSTNSIACDISEPSFTAGSVTWQIRKKRYASAQKDIIRDSILYSDSQTVQGRSFSITIPKNVPDAYFSLYVWNDSFEGRAGFKFNESSVSQNHRHQKRGVSFKINVANSRCLVFSFGSPLSGTAKVEFYQLNGQRTSVLNIPEGTETFRYDHGVKGPLSGTKIVVLRVNGRVVGKQVIQILK